MDIRKIQRLVEILQDSDVTEFEFSEGEQRIRICRGTPAAPMQAAPVYAPMPGPVQGVVPAAVQPAAGVASASIDITGHVVKSPMVGTFYRSPSPEAEPFVQEGDLVKSGQALCIIEAMKLLNEIEADVSGRIVKVLAENGQPVEYGEPLFVIDVNG
ncbi:acetyl-CoA carboxylase biotin carboxyl carrier protein [Thermithiobacillus plumbiphilus]|uniref:Biotin carboxyl carrier protein of acetyl-CoA carboxylase n=1 Tax=Thermithiobacillus plumbiphilus TaxID=1729899 RepID=A0ABU9DB82_9PROT